MKNRIRELIRAIKAGGKSAGKFVLPSVLSVVAAFFLATHLRPDLTVFFAYGEVIAFQINNEPNRFRTVLVDWLDEDGPRIVSATDVTFTSVKDVKWRSDRGREWISKFVIYNEGWVTANHITIGIGIPAGAELLKVVASPNISILSDKLVQTSASYPSFRKIDIERLGRSEQAVLTVLTTCSCGSPARPKVADADLFIATDKSSKNYSPVLFLSSEEGTGRIMDSLSIKDVFALEKGLYPSSTSGYWASSVDVAKNAAEPKLEPVAHMKITMSVEDKDGKQRDLSLTFP